MCVCVCVCVCMHTRMHTSPKPHPVPHEDGLEGVFVGAGAAGHRDELGHPFRSHLWGGKQLWAPHSPSWSGASAGAAHWALEAVGGWEGNRDAVPEAV